MIHAAHRRRPIARLERGSFMLEALIGILIFSFGILGLVGLQAQSIRHMNEAQYRGEAVYLANSVVSKMWADDPANLSADYLMPSGPGYLAFLEDVKSLPGSSDTQNKPQIKVEAGPSKQSKRVTVTVYWVLPGDDISKDATLQHNYSTMAIVGINSP